MLWIQSGRTAAPAALGACDDRHAFGSRVIGSRGTARYGRQATVEVSVSRLSDIFRTIHPVFAALALALAAGGCSDKAGPGSGQPGVMAAGGSAGTDAAGGGAAGVAGIAGAGGMALPADDVPVDFFKDIQPILTEHCVRCHGGVRELPLTPVPLNLQSREKAAHVLGEAGNPDSSRLYVRVILEEPTLRMPLNQAPLLPEQVNKIRRWIFQGAPWPAHWAFAPNPNPDPNAVTVMNAGWVKTPLDRFVLSQLEAKSIMPSAEAPKETLLRRVSLDLTGLPPTPEEVDAFVADTGATAYETVVDRLLASPAFGERWARHWLDQARYADSAGYESDEDRYNAYKWRDWVIDSINRDQPFDDFTVEQIAGDLIQGATDQQRTGTGFHVNTLLNREGGADKEEDRVKRILDRTATVGQVWLGLTMGCSQCHGHPYDRVTQGEFYNLYAFFNNADDGMEAGDGPTIPSDKAPMLTERTSDRRNTYLLTRGNFLDPDETQAFSGGTPGALHAFTTRGATPDRLDLANWLVSPDNALTPRVVVNTIWSHLFGRGLVASLDDFGARALPPSNPQLLDWLAAEFGRLGFSRKQLIRVIVLSATYRQASVVRADTATSDPDNLLLHRQNRLRVEAEIVGDIFLSASGLLDKTVGGPSVYPPIPDEVLRFSYNPVNWPTSTGADRYRRGMYTFHKRTSLHPNLALFDRPKAQVTDNLRARSNTPLQAMATLHDQNFVEAAQALARRVQAAVPGNTSGQITLAFRLALGRSPKPAELSALEALLAKNQTTYGGQTSAAEQAVGTPAPEGVPIASAAAMANVARMILNLDEVITRE
jgi:hypothetical protein